MDSLTIPGISIAIINDGRIVYHQVFGVSNLETQEKVPAFLIGGGFIRLHQSKNLAKEISILKLTPTPSPILVKDINI